MVQKIFSVLNTDYKYTLTFNSQCTLCAHTCLVKPVENIQGSPPCRASHTIVILNPGHFHAALTLRERHPLIDDDVHVFTEDGPDVDHFLRLVQAFNDRPSSRRAGRSTSIAGRLSGRLLAQRPGEVVIIAAETTKNCR